MGPNQGFNDVDDSTNWIGVMSSDIATYTCYIHTQIKSKFRITYAKNTLQSNGLTGI